MEETGGGGEGYYLIDVILLFITFSAVKSEVFYDISFIAKRGARLLPVIIALDKLRFSKSGQIFNTILHFSLPFPPFLRHLILSLDFSLY